jgi:hypothetical protein
MDFIQSLADIALKFQQYLPFIFILGILSAILYKADKDSALQFRIYDLVSDPVTGKASLEKIGMLVGQLSITWWFMDRAAQSKATIEEVLVYGGLIGVSKVASQLINAKYGQKSDAKE